MVARMTETTVGTRLSDGVCTSHAVSCRCLVRSCLMFQLEDRHPMSCHCLRVSCDPPSTPKSYAVESQGSCACDPTCSCFDEILHTTTCDACGGMSVCHPDGKRTMDISASGWMLSWTTRCSRAPSKISLLWLSIDVNEPAALNHSEE